MRPKSRQLKLVGVLVPLLLMAGALGLVALRVRGAEPFVNPADAPGSPCWELARLGNLPPEKLGTLESECERLQAAGDSLPPKGSPPTAPPLPTRPPLPPCDEWTPSATVQGCVMYGVIESRQPPAGFEGTYLVTNIWAGDRVTIYAGSLRDDASQGILVVMENNTWPPKRLGEYPTPVKGGSVRIVGAEGERLTLVSESGATFVFDVALRQFLSP